MFPANSSTGAVSSAAKLKHLLTVLASSSRNFVQELKANCTFSLAMTAVVAVASRGCPGGTG